MKKAIFLDRDNTLIFDKGYIHKPEDVELIDTVPSALKLAKQKGFLLVVISNQSGIGRGYFTESDFHAVNRKIEKLLNSRGISIDAWYFCPHKPDEDCNCRKPKPYLVHKAAEELKIDVKRSYVIGDKDIDVELAKNSGCRKGVKVGTKDFPFLIDAVRFIITDYEKAFNNYR